MSEIARFLHQRVPFDALATDELAEVAAQAAIEFHLRGAVILSEDEGPVTFLRVVHSGAVDITHDGRLLDLLGPGDTFGHAAMLSGLPPGFEARAAEDTLCYRIPVVVARPLLDRARRRELQVGETAEAYQPVAKLIRAPVVRCRPSENVGFVAARMTAAGVSAAVVELEDGGIGILTDRDLRSRVLAVGRSGAVRVDSAMTAPAYVVSPDRLAGEVLYEMLERGVRHVPVVSERGRLMGVVEDADLVAAQPRSWFGARRAIERAGSLDALTAAAARLPELMLDLHHSSVPALALAPVLSALVDALTRRALDLAGAAAGADVPDGLVWVSVGSQARRELTPGSIRRGALIHAAEEPPPPEWVAAVQNALARCGVQGEIVAGEAAQWRRRAAGDDELALSVLADRRVLWGTPAEPLPVADGEERDAILRALARQAFSPALPTGFDAEGVLTLDGRHSALNIRSAAIVPIAAIARWAAALADAGEGSTPERLRAAADAGAIGSDHARTLVEAFELALELRIGHQLQVIAAGAPPDDLLDASAMSPLTRNRLRDVFRAIGAAVRELRP